MSADERVGGESRARLASRLALLGGRIALERFHRATTTWKSDGSLVTDADLAIQEELAREIAAAFPADAVFGEEAEGAAAVRPHASYAWVLDPIDGTNNFARGLPGFAVSVGVLRDGVPFAGAVYDPLARWLFTGAAGRGAWLNDRPLHAGAVGLSAQSLFAIRAPWAEGVPPFVEGWLRRYRLRRFGSTALQLCYVAMGALAFVHDQHAFLWDVAGAAPILLEAGGLLTVADGSPLFPLTPATQAGPLALLAGNPVAHRQAAAEILEATAVA